jgi:hypothetical protein
MHAHRSGRQEARGEMTAKRRFRNRGGLVALASGLLAAGAMAGPGTASAQSAPAHVTLGGGGPDAAHPYRHGTVPLRGHSAPHTGYSPTTAAASTGNLAYGGGNDGVGVIDGPPKVYLVFYGSQWGTSSTNAQGYTVFSGDPDGVAQTMEGFFEGLGTNGETWSGVMTQYCQGVATGAQSCPSGADYVGHPTNGALAGIYLDTGSAAPSQATSTQLGQEAINAANAFNNTTAASNRDAIYVIASPTGTHPDGFNSSSGNFCAWHSYTDAGSGPVAFVNQPYIPDAGGGCGMNAVNGGSAGTDDGVTITVGHEYAETLTDQTPAGGWVDSSGAENGDKCAWVNSGQGAMTDLSLSTGSYAVQSTWANDFNGGQGGCEMSHPIMGGSSGGGAPATGAITGINGLCLDDWQSSTADFNKIDVYTCNGTGAQNWTVASNGTLQVLGGCLDVAGAGTTAGTKVDYYPCNGTVAQQWQYNSSTGALVNPNSGLCLDDPDSNTTPGGAQMQIWTCNGTAAQKWTLP